MKHVWHLVNYNLGRFVTLPKGWWYTAADARLHVTSSKHRNFLSVWSVWMSVNFSTFHYQDYSNHSDY